MSNIKVEVPYGTEKISGYIPEKYSIENIYPKETSYVQDTYQEVLEALSNPIGTVNLTKMKNSQKIAVVINDISRPVPTKEMLSSLLTWFNQYGIKSSQLVILIGNGLHRLAKNEEIKNLLPQEILVNSTIVNHDAYNFKDNVEVGCTSRGTPVVINRYYMESDYRIVVGMIEPHQFVGFTGGAKGAVIGLSGEKTINANHKMLIDEKAQPGCLVGNPVREDIDEMGNIVGIDLIINVVLNFKKKVVKVVAGHYLEAHRKGVEMSEAMSRVNLDIPADLVIASPGGYPKDSNLYQTQKALYHAEKLVKIGGVIILAARLNEGIGDELFEEKLRMFASPKEVLEDFHKHPFKVRSHKAYLWCRTLVNTRTILVSSEGNKDLSEIMKVECVSSLQEAFNISLNNLTPGAKVYLIPNALSVVPVLHSCNSD